MIGVTGSLQSVYSQYKKHPQTLVILWSCPFSIVGILYALCICISIGVNVVTPLSYELACEITYPAFEGIPAAILCIFNNLSGPLFYGLFLVPSLAKGEHDAPTSCF